MSEALRLAALIGIQLSDLQRYAFLYLEGIGQKFCTHFGTDNAVDKAAEHFAEHADGAR